MVKGGDLTVKLQMAAIVNTLTSFDNINGVLFVCDGKKVPIVGAFDTKSPVKTDGTTHKKNNVRNRPHQYDEVDFFLHSYICYNTYSV